jgi:hypothetical protein
VFGYGVPIALNGVVGRLWQNHVGHVAPACLLPLRRINITSPF